MTIHERDAMLSTPLSALPPYWGRVAGDRRRAGRSRLARVARLLACAILAAAGAVHAGLWFNQREMIYLPWTVVPPVERVLPGAEEVTFPTADGLMLAGWFLPPAQPAPERATVLLFHGNGGNRASVAPLAGALAGAGLAVLVVDYRGYGGNPGQPAEAGLLEDARAARAYLLGRRDVDPTRLVYVGESLGTGVAVALAAEAPPLALVLRSPFTSLVDVARPTYWWLPLEVLLLDQYRSIDRVAAIAVPLLVIAGEADTLVPSELSRQVCARAAGPKRLLVIAGAGHNDPALAYGPTLVEGTAHLVRAAAAGVVVDNGC